MLTIELVAGEVQVTQGDEGTQAVPLAVGQRAAQQVVLQVQGLQLEEVGGVSPLVGDGASEPAAERGPNN